MVSENFLDRGNWKRKNCIKSQQLRPSKIYLEFCGHLGLISKVQFSAEVFHGEIIVPLDKFLYSYATPSHNMSGPYCVPQIQYIQIKRRIVMNNVQNGYDVWHTSIYPVDIWKYVLYYIICTEFFLILWLWRDSMFSFRIQR